MKNFCTSIEQSNELLKFGINADTADLHYESTPDGNYEIIVGRVKSDEDIPAWSLSALIELLPSGFIFKDTNGECTPEKYYVWVPGEGSKMTYKFHDSPLDAVADKLIRINSDICDRCDHSFRCSKSNYIKSQCERNEI